jgi:hypothetical protein
MRRFPDQKDALREKYRFSESFQSICWSYQKCKEALEHWTQSKHAEAPKRQQEYTKLMKELEQELIQSLGEDF